jgi:WD40 repeat protein/serine/threonine protein kinase
MDETRPDAVPPTRWQEPSPPAPDPQPAGARDEPSHGEQTSDFLEAAPAPTDENLSFGSRDTIGQAASVTPAEPGRPSPARYRILGRLAQGGMGVIYRVWDESLRRLLAMKIIRGQEQLPSSGLSSVDPQLLARFLREAEITGQLDHPGVVPVHEIGTDAHGRVYFTMRLVQGDSLSTVLDRVAKGDADWTQTRVLDVLIKVCETLAFAHSRGIVHRDLKPDNIMVGRFGETYVMDWGLAKRQKKDEGGRRKDEGGRMKDEPAGSGSSFILPPSSLDMTVAGAVLGTPFYMPPEQAAGRLDELDERADVYAVGAMLYRLLTGQHPYARPPGKRTVQEILADVRAGPPTPVRQLSPRVPGELVAICEKAMARHRAERYAGAQEMADDLRAYLENRVVRAYRTGAAAEFRKWVVRNRLAALAGAAALVAAVGGLTTTLGVYFVANRDLLAANTKVTEERNAKQESLLKEQAARQKAEGLYLARQASDVLPTNPGLAVLLARESARLHPGLVANDTLLAGLDACREERTLLSHAGSVCAVAFSPDGTQLVTATREHTACVWDAATGRRVALLVGHRDWVTKAFFSPDGRRIVTASRDGTAAVWDASSGACLRRLEGHSGPLDAAALSRDGRRLATGSWNGIAQVWDLESGQRGPGLTGHASPIDVVTFSPDGTRLLTAASDKTARVWNLERGTLQSELRGHDGGLSAASFSPDGRLIVTAAGGEIVLKGGGGERRQSSVDRAPRIWDAATGKLVRRLEGHTEPVLEAAFSPDGRHVVTGGADQVARIWDVASGRVQRTLEGHDGAIRSVTFSPDGRRVAVITVGRTVSLWDAVSGERLTALQGHDDRILCCAFSPDGSRLLTGSTDGTARLWRLAGIVPTLEIPERAGATVRVSPDGRRLLARPFGATTVHLWSMPDGRPVATLAHESPVVEARFSPDSAVVCTVCRSGAVRLWSAERGTRLAALSGAGRANSAVFSPDGRRLLVLAPPSACATCWDVPSAVLTRRLGLPWNGLQFGSPDGRFLLVCAPNGKELQLWDTHDGRRVARLQEENGQARGDFSPDGACLVTWSAGTNRARLWSTETGQQLATLDGHTDCLNRITFSADAKWIVTASNDGTARIWDAATGAAHAHIVGEDGPVTLAVLGPGGKRLVTRAQDKTARLWDVETGRSLAFLGGGDSLLQAAQFATHGDLLLLHYGEDPRVGLWDAEGAVPLAIVEGHHGAITDVTLSPDGRWLVTAATGRVLRVWPTAPAVLADQVRPRDLSPDERDRFSLGTAEERSAARREADLRRAEETRRLLNFAGSVPSTDRSGR